MPQFIGRKGLEKHLGEEASGFFYKNHRFWEFSGMISKDESGELFVKAEENYHDRCFV